MKLTKFLLKCMVVGMVSTTVMAAEISPYVGGDLQWRMIRAAGNGIGGSSDFGTQAPMLAYYGGLNVDDLSFELGAFTYKSGWRTFVHKVKGTHFTAYKKFDIFLDNRLRTYLGIGLSSLKKDDLIIDEDGTLFSHISNKTNAPRLSGVLEWGLNENVFLRANFVVEKNDRYRKSTDQALTPLKAPKGPYRRGAEPVDYSFNIGLKYVF